MTKSSHDTNSSALNTVITGDLVDSTGSRLSQRQLTTGLATVFSNLHDFLDPDAILLPFTISRGDSFQGVLRGTQDSLLTVIYLRCAIRQTLKLDVRQAIGIGRTEEIVDDSTLRSSGEAFLRSGRMIERMTTRRSADIRIAVNSDVSDFDEQFHTYFVLFEAIAARWTAKECEAIYLKLHNWNQTEIAEYLGINQSAVHKRLKAADWPAVQALLERWKVVVTRLFAT